MRRIILLISILFSITLLNAQHRYHFRVNAPQGFSVVSSTATNLSLHYSINEIGIADIDNGEVKGQEIMLKGSFGSFAEEQPNLPYENRYIAVPQGATVRIEVKERGIKALHDIDLLPAAPVQVNSAIGLPELHKDMSVFGKDDYFPSENVTIAQSTCIRGLDVVLLSVTPFRYNPVRKTLEVIYDMDIEIRFESGNGQFGDPRYRNPDWDHILRNMVINSDMLPESHYYERLNEAIQNRETVAEYLIITPDDESLVAWADTLKDFRNKQGVLTKVVTTTECGGNTAEQIKGYIQNAYDNWTIPPAAVMIFNGLTDTMSHSWPLPEAYVGGTEGIPGFPLVFVNYNDQGENHNYKSDSPYADMNGDSIPDLAISRIPVMTPEEYQLQVNKLIQYETTPPSDPSYYDQPVITSGYEYNKWFLITSQSVNGFFQNYLGKRPWNFYMVYEYTQPEPSFPDSAWSTGYNTATVVDYFGPDGQNYFPRYPNDLNDWRDMNNNSYLKEALNSNSFFTLYRDHSASHWWCCPVFEYGEIDNLTNTEPTFILSIGCHTAKYTKTYLRSNWNPHIIEPSVLNTFCKHNVGSIGGIGAVTVTHSQYNDILTWGFIDYVWPAFMPTLGSHTAPEFVRPSYGLVASKLFLNEHAFLPDFWPVKVLTTNNVFHYIGETYLNLYTEMPQTLTLEAPLQHPNAQWHYQFTVEEGATVCFSKDSDILHVVKGTGVPQIVVLPEMAVGEQFTITATMQNHYRLEQTVTVVHSGAATSENQVMHFDLYPDPTDGMVTISVGQTIQGKVVVEVFNLLGDRMMAKDIHHLQKGDCVNLDLHQLAPGQYVVKLCTDMGNGSKIVNIRR